MNGFSWEGCKFVQLETYRGVIDGLTSFYVSVEGCKFVQLVKLQSILAGSVFCRVSVEGCKFVQLKHGYLSVDYSALTGFS